MAVGDPEAGNSLPLHRAIAHYLSPEPVVIAILKAKPDASEELSPRQWLPLHMMAQRQGPGATEEAIGALLNARPSAAAHQLPKERSHGSGHYALHIALRHGASDRAVRALISAHPPAVREMGGVEGETPLHLAAKWSRSSAIVAVLLRMHPLAVRLPDAHGYLPLHCALVHGAPAGSVQLLLRAFPTAAHVGGPNGELPLHLAIEYGAPVAVLRWVLEANPAGLLHLDAFGNTPLSLLGDGTAARLPPFAAALSEVSTSLLEQNRTSLLRAHLSRAARRINASHARASLALRAFLAGEVGPSHEASLTGPSLAGTHRGRQLQQEEEQEEGQTRLPTHRRRPDVRSTPPGALPTELPPAHLGKLEDEVELGGRDARRRQRYLTRVQRRWAVSCGVQQSEPSSIQARLGSPGGEALRMGARAIEREKHRAAAERAAWASGGWVGEMSLSGGARSEVHCTGSSVEGPHPSVPYLRVLGELRSLGCAPASSPKVCFARCARTLGCLGWSIELGSQDRMARFVRTIPLMDPLMDPPHDGFPVPTCCLHVVPPNLPTSRFTCSAQLTAGACRNCSSFESTGGVGGDQDTMGADLSIPLAASTFPWVGVWQHHVRRMRTLHNATRAELISLGDDEAEVVHTAQQPSESAPDAPPSLAPSERAAPRVAVCAAGSARTFVHPSVWGTLPLILSRLDAQGPTGARLDLFLVLGTTGEAPSDSYGFPGPQPPPEPALLARALTALQPARVRFLSQPQPVSCGHNPTGQFAKWASCVDLIREHERAVGGGAPLYEWLFKTRPDLRWHRPLDLTDIASRLRPEVVLGANDINLLLHRSQWHALTRLRPGRLRCEPRCDGTTAAGIRRFFKGVNEYCLLVSAFAEAGAIHIESSHPREKQLMMKHTVHYSDQPASWANEIAKPSYSIVRFRKRGLWYTRGALQSATPVGAAVDQPGGGGGAAKQQADEDEVVLGYEGHTELRANMKDPFELAVWRQPQRDWYFREVLLGGVVCRGRGATFRPMAGKMKSFSTASGQKCPHFVCTPCSNAALLTSVEPLLISQLEHILGDKLLLSGLLAAAQAPQQLSECPVSADFAPYLSRSGVPSRLELDPIMAELDPSVDASRVSPASATAFATSAASQAEFQWPSENMLLATKRRRTLALMALNLSEYDEAARACTERALPRRGTLECGSLAKNCMELLSFVPVQGTGKPQLLGAPICRVSVDGFITASRLD